MPEKNTERFSNRADDYVKYRPGYPESIVDYLENEFGLAPDHTIADIGSGTGISSALFLNRGYTVQAIEPNKEMRLKATEWLGSSTAHQSINATAENTTLPTDSMDMIVAGQAFHWFDREKAKQEFKRILKPGGMVVLIWNERQATTNFELEYDLLIQKYAIDYTKVEHRNIRDNDIEYFFSPGNCTLQIFDNYQDFDLEGLTGRLLSSSYMPKEEDAAFESMCNELSSLFKRYNEHNSIRINYVTKVYVGRFRLLPAPNK